MAKKQPKPKGDGKGKGGGCKILAAIVIIIMIMWPAMAADNLMNPNQIKWATTVTHQANFTNVNVGGVALSSGTIANDLTVTGTYRQSMAGPASFGYINDNNSLAVRTQIGSGTSKTGYINVNSSATVGTQLGVTGPLKVGYISNNNSYAGTGNIGTAAALKGKTGAINDSDGLTVNNIIVPQVFYLTYPMDNYTFAAASGKYIFTAPANCKIVSVSEVHTTAANLASTAIVRKMTSAQTVAQGTAVTTAGFLLNSAADTAVSRTVTSGTNLSVLVNTTDKIGVYGYAASTGLRGSVITIGLIRV
jgi:hypothetical protein